MVARARNLARRDAAAPPTGRREEHMSDLSEAGGTSRARGPSHPAGALPPATRMGAVRLGVADLDRSRRYYEHAIGLRTLERGATRLILGMDGEPLVELEAEPDARPSRGHTGLYHLALLLPDRPSLARWLRHAAREGVPLVGAADHAVSEAVYLTDPDGHGVEVYADRPRRSWEGRVAELMTTLPLDVEGLLAAADDPPDAPFAGLPAGTAMGHVHLRVASLPDAVAFYRDVLGLELMATLGAGAAFLAAGGYHHHIAANSWESSGAPPPPPGTAALRHATIVLPGTGERDAVAGRVAAAGQEPRRAEGGVMVRDPSGNALLLQAAGAPG
jgi:catechol 2,3-dioxygenase